MARRAANPKAIPRHVNYQTGVFTVTTDLRAIIQAVGIERTLQLAAILDADIKREVIRKHNSSRKINDPVTKMLAKQVAKHTRKQIGAR